jgi:SlyX protein
MTNEIEDLQERIAYLERMVEEMSDELAKRGQVVDVLTRRVEMLLHREAEREADVGGTVPLADQKPPHW